ncbi:hypothetical protein GJAV_G00125560 [Gymnothorax javanicus]|nr:hypothetical protein GJAV_G00125560 [Gymnothorax javanicus]
MGASPLQRNRREGPRRGPAPSAPPPMPRPSALSRSPIRTHVRTCPAPPFLLSCPPVQPVYSLSISPFPPSINTALSVPLSSSGNIANYKDYNAQVHYVCSSTDSVTWTSLESKIATNAAVLSAPQNSEDSQESQRCRHTL